MPDRSGKRRLVFSFVLVESGFGLHCVKDLAEQTLGTAILPFIALLLLGAGMAALESGAMPAWTAWLAFAGAALSVVLTLQLAYAGPVLVAVGVVHALAAIGWIAVASVYLLLPERRAMVASAGIA